VLIGDLHDTRNLDNLIVRQLHALFLKFHNETMRQLQKNAELDAFSRALGPGSIFERARRLVVWHYQWIIRHDYLPRVLSSNTWKHLSQRSAGRPEGDFAVPIEFSLAAFRFGHSMVRNAYRLNCRNKRVVIADLMQLGQSDTPIQDDYLAEWGTFFDGLPTSGPQASSSFIDTSLTAAMHGLSDATIRIANKNEAVDPSSLPVRTLLRGARAGLPSGQEIAEMLVSAGRLDADEALTALELTGGTTDQSGTVLHEQRLENRTPLFYYILKEAELRAEGLTLGPVGSHIVGETILQALERDPEGYMAVAGKSWKLPRWRFPSGARREVNSLIAMIRLVGDDKLLPECEAHWRRFQLPPNAE
jgi:hypothetical protein